MIDSPNLMLAKVSRYTVCNELALWLTWKFKISNCESVGRSRKKGDITSDNVVPMVTLRWESVRVYVLPQLVGTGGHISDVNPLAVKVTAVIVTTVLGDTLYPCSTAIATDTTENMKYCVHRMLRASLTVIWILKILLYSIFVADDPFRIRLYRPNWWIICVFNFHSLH